MGDPVELSNGYWYIKTNYDPGWSIVSVLKIVLGPEEGKFMVWQFDEEGYSQPSEFTFIGKVGPPQLR